MNLQSTIAFVLEPFSYFLTGAFLFFYSRKDERIKIKVLFAYNLAAALLLVKSTFFNRVDSNIEVYSLLGLLIFLSVGAYFYMTLLGSLKKRIVVLLCVIDVLYYVTNSIFLDRPNVFDSVGYVILSTGITVMIFLFMHQLLNNISDEPLVLNFDFWFTSAQLVYNLGAFVIFLTYNYLSKKIMPYEQHVYSPERSLLTSLWGLHNILLLLSSLIISTGVIWITRHKRSLNLK